MSRIFNLIPVFLVAMLMTVGGSRATDETAIVSVEVKAPLELTYSENITIMRSARFGETVWAVTDFLPGGANTAFAGVPDPNFSGADVVEYLMEDVEIPRLNQPVTVETRQVLLNEKSIVPLEADLNRDGETEMYNFYFVIDPDVETIGRLMIVQTSPDDFGPGPEGVYMQASTLHFLTKLVPLDEEGNEINEGTIVESGSIPLIAPVPIPFSFDPPGDTPLVEGLVGDFLANWHLDKIDGEKNFFSLGGLTQMPHGGRPLHDVNGKESIRGGASSAAAGIYVDLSDNYNENMLPDYFESTLTPLGTPAPAARGVAIVYNSVTGEVGVSVPEGVELNAINISSALGIFIEEDAQNLNRELTIDVNSDVLVDRDNRNNIFKASFGESFGSLSFGSVALVGLPEDIILEDLSARVLFADGFSYGLLELIYEYE